ncbi:MAG: beta strand repeat-containing protein, partial [Lachnospiraceae bacterium]
MGRTMIKRLKESKGFTLIEMIITITIITILSGLVIAGITGYVTTAYMNRVNETAKTVFFATQNYLTREKQLGNLSEVNDIAKSYGSEISEATLEQIFKAQDPNFDFNAYKEKYSTSSIRYILLNKGQGTMESSNPIYTIVNTYIEDKELLENTFLIEYDSKSGVVRSVFYTEKANTFTYDGDQTTRENIMLRDSKSLRSKRQGYYGVDTTSLAKYNIDIDSPKEVMLVNEERLYLQWKESDVISTNPSLNDSLNQDLIYKVEVYREKGNKDELLFTIDDIKTSDSYHTSLALAEARLNNNKLVISYKDDIYQLMFDSVHNSIFDLFYGSEKSDQIVINENASVEQLSATDVIYCTVSVSLDDTTEYQGESLPAVSNLQSSNYGGGDESITFQGTTTIVSVGGNGYLEEDGTSEEDGTAFSVHNARHLNNMRNAKNTACFVQRGSIDWATSEEDENAGLFNEDFEPVSFKDMKGSSIKQALETETIYQGMYRVAKSSLEENEVYKISNIKIRKNTNNNVGIFKENMGSISGIYLEKSSISGGHTVGAIAGSNGYKGIIKDITLDTCEVSGGFYVGGIVGKNIENAEILNIKSKTNVLANTTLEAVDTEKNASLGQYVGGIAGENSGSIKEATTAIIGTSTIGTGSVAGLKNVGGIVGANRGNNAIVEEALNYNRIVLLDENAKDLADFGGIAGSNDEQGTISNSSNMREISMELNGYNTLRAQDRVENIGGIVGRNNSTVKNSSYKVELESKKTEFLNNLLTELKKSKMPQYFGVNVGGLIGLNEKNGVVSDCTSDGIVVGYRVVGGAIGYNKGRYAHITSFVGRILSAFNTKMTQVSGLVVASDQLAGGIFGANEGASITDLTNNANVFAKSGAGGIIGVNGAYGSFTELNVENENYYNNLIQPSFANGTIINNATISNCKNTGLVYALTAYAGGISGINTGTITKSNSVVRSLELFTLEDYKQLSYADCVGGIVGLNIGTITGDSGTTTVTQVYGRDFIGGIVGLNKGEVSNYRKAEGEVYSSGQAVGGTIGLNWNSKTLSDNTVNNDNLTIYGEYFVGGAFGCNVTSQSGEDTSFEKTTIGSEVKIEGNAYVGGILGYQTSVGTDSFQDVVKDLENQNKKAFEAYNHTAGSSPGVGLKATIFRNCENNATVIGKRYVGGIIGYNSNISNLYVTKTNNYGAISINTTENNTTDDYYLIGGITGLNSAGGVIDQCINDGAVNSPSKYLGGISEINEGYIQFCVVGSSQNYTQDTQIVGENSVGGIVGLNNKYVVHCTTSVYAVIRGGNNTGGLVGTNGTNGVITGDGGKASPAFGSNNGDTNGTEVAGSVIGKNNTGGIVGLNEGSVEQVSIKDAKVAGETNVGGFIGYNGATGSITPGTSPTIGVIKDLTNNAELVVGRHMVGGIVGAHEASIIENCTNQGTVRATGDISTSSVATGYAGGITGYVGTGVTIKNSKNEGVVESDKSQAGGIAANNEGTVENCTNIGNVSGSRVASENSAIGGIVGINERTGKVKDNRSIKNNDETNVIDGNYIVGGLIGYNKGEISNTKDPENNVTIPITVTKSTVSGIKDSKYPHIGGIIGKVEETNDSTLKNFIFSGTIRVDANASQENYVGGIIGRLPRNMILENCIFDGTILGEGNGYAIDSSSNKTGVGGIAGYSAGTIVVYGKEIDGGTVYASNTKTSTVEGISNIGGVVGIINATHTIKLRIDGNDELIGDTSNYYTNYTQVRGIERVGGFYGQTDFTASITISKLQNEATILPNTTVSGSVNKKKTPTGFGGILGSSWAEGSTKYSVLIESCINRGNFGIENTTYGAIAAIGGILGSGHNNLLTGEYMSLNNVKNCENYGNFYYGTTQIGGIVGRIKYGTIEKCTNDGDIIRPTINYAGGILGEVTAGTLKAKTILRSVTNNGNIKTKGGNYIGGIFGGSTHSGYFYAQIEGSSSNTGSIEIISSTKNIMIGGIVGNGTKVSIIGTKEDPIVNEGSITIKSPELDRAGGIVGYIEGGNVEYAKNEGEIKLENSSNNSEKFYHIGGIIGRTWEPVKVNNCNNTGKITINQALYIGGIIGSTEGTVEVNDCTNEKSIEVTQGLYVGGIIGCINNNTTNVKIKNSMNMESGSIGGFNRYVGGVVGGIHENAIGLITVEINDCTNYAKIEGREYVGGIIGRLAARSDNTGSQSLMDCENKGEIFGQTNEKNETISYIGGIIGYASGDAEMNLFVNTGNITIDTTQTTLSGDKNLVVQDIGGIVGYFAARDQNGSSISKIVDATNKGKITFELSESPKETTVVRVGGIAGSVSANSKIEYCINEASVLAPKDSSTDIGGITGKNQGLLYSNVTKENVIVQGYENVGGIAGSTIGIKSKITSVVKGTDSDTIEYTITQNNAAVFGTKKVGGIVGYSQVATIQTVLNTGAVTLGTSTLLDETTSAGGIVGTSQFLEESTIKGVIANAYNFGKVKFENSSNQRYLGGLVGYRELNGTSASTSIKDSFYYDNNSIDSSQPNGDIPAAVLAIGSEPEGAYHVDSEDQDRGAGKQVDLEKPVRYKWSEAVYNELYKVFTG